MNQSKNFISKSKNINIPCNPSNCNIYNNKNTSELNYETKCNLVDPNKSSPPNYFLNKLIMRLNYLQNNCLEKRL